MRIKKLLTTLALFTGVAFGQAARYDNIAPVLTANGLFAAPHNATVLVYTYPGPNISCASGGCAAATTYIDSTLTTTCGSTVPLTGPLTNACLGQIDIGGNFGFWVKPGKYQYCINSPGNGQQCFNIVVASDASSTITVPGSFYATAFATGSTTGGIQEAINAAAALPFGVVILPNGTTNACSVTVPANVTVTGYGVAESTVQCATAASSVFTVTGGGVEMSGFTAKHTINTPVAGGNGITVNGATGRARLHDLRTSFNYDGLNLNWTTYSELTNVVTEFNQNDGVNFIPSSSNPQNAWQVRGVLSEQNLNNGFELSLPANFTNVQTTCPMISGWTQAFGNVGNGFKFSASAATTSGISDCWLSGTFASANNASGYLLDLGSNGGRNAILSGVYSELSGTYTGTAGFAQTSQSPTNVGYGIEITSACDPTSAPIISGGLMWENSFSGILAACAETTITGVNTFANGQAASGSAFQRAGISVRANQVQVNGGTYRGGGGGKQTSGVEVSNSADKPHLNDVNCDADIATCVLATTVPANGFQNRVGPFLANSVVIYNTNTSALTASVSPTTMFTAGTAGGSFQFSFYVSLATLGTSCAGATTLVVNVIYTDPAASGTTTQSTATFNLATTNGVLGTPSGWTIALAQPISFRAKASTAVQYSTTFTAGGSCSPAPAYIIYPQLVQVQ